jgi:hypothetical protein
MSKETCIIELEIAHRSQVCSKISGMFRKWKMEIKRKGQQYIQKKNKETQTP